MIIVSEFAIPICRSDRSLSLPLYRQEKNSRHSTYGRHQTIQSNSVWLAKKQRNSINNKRWEMQHREHRDVKWKETTICSHRNKKKNTHIYILAAKSEKLCEQLPENDSLSMWNGKQGRYINANTYTLFLSRTNTHIKTEIQYNGPNTKNKIKYYIYNINCWVLVQVNRQLANYHAISYLQWVNWNLRPNFFFSVLHLLPLFDRADYTLLQNILIIPCHTFRIG